MTDDKTGKVGPAQNRTKTGRFAKGTSGNPSTRFQPGLSGNPGGRPRSLAETIKAKVGDDGEALVAQLLKIANRRGSAWGRVQAIRELLDRGWGRAPLDVKIEASVEQRGGWDLSKLDVAELRELKRLALKAGGAVQGDVVVYRAGTDPDALPPVRAKFVLPSNGRDEAPDA